MDKRPSLLRSAFLTLGGIVGAGVFALPSAFRQTGILAGSLVYWAIALAVLVLHLLYAEIVLARPDLMAARLPGQAGLLFGKWARRFAYIVYPSKLIGACIIYIILGGQFLSVLAGHVGIKASAGIWQVFFWSGGVVTVAFGLAIVAKVESWLTRGLVLLILLCVLVLVSHADGNLFRQVMWPGVSAIPFGTFVFSLIGWTVIPEIATLLGHARRITKLAVAAGTLLGAFLMWLFGIFVYAADAGLPDLGPAAIAAAMPDGWSWVIPALGFLAIASAFVTISEAFRAMLRNDAHFSAHWSRIIALGLPFALLFLTSGDFRRIVDFVGSYLTTLNALLICAMAWVVMRKLEHGRDAWRLAAPWACGAMFLGVLLEKLLVR